MRNMLKESHFRSSFLNQLHTGRIYDPKWHSHRLNLLSLPFGIICGERVVMYMGIRKKNTKKTNKTASCSIKKIFLLSTLRPQGRDTIIQNQQRGTQKWKQKIRKDIREA